jgi:hypothetical protein
MYKLINDYNGQVSMIYKVDEKMWIPLAPNNTDYEAYLKWLADGNTPLPADEVTQ